MGALVAYLMNALRLAGPAAIGYFFNDAATWIGKQFPSTVDTNKPANPDGSPALKWWVIVLIFLGAGLILFFVLKMFSGGRGKKKGFFAVAILLGAGLSLYLDPITGGMLATALITLTTGVGVLTSANSTYVPKYFFYAAATQLTGVKITVQGDGVIFDSDANGLNHCGVSRLLGQVTNTYFFRLANGFIVGKNVLWEFTNSAAQTPTIYIDSDTTPPAGQELYLQLIRQPAIGPGGTDFTNFATLSFPSMATTDYANILYADGTQQSNMVRNDLQAMLQLTQNILNTPIYQVDNYGQRVKKVNFQATATQTAYVQRWVPPVSGGMISQAIIARNG